MFTANSSIAAAQPGLCKILLARAATLFKGDLKKRDWAIAGLLAKYPEFKNGWPFLKDFETFSQESTMLGKSHVQWHGQHSNGMWFNVSMGGWVSTDFDMKNSKTLDPLAVLQKHAKEKGLRVEVIGQEQQLDGDNYLRVQLPSQYSSELSVRFVNPTGEWQGGNQFQFLSELQTLIQPSALATPHTHPPTALGPSERLIQINQDIELSMTRIKNDPEAFVEISRKIASFSIDYDAAEKALGASPSSSKGRGINEMRALFGLHEALYRPAKFLFAAINSNFLSHAQRRLAVDSLVQYIEGNPYFIDGPMFRDLSERFPEFSEDTLSQFPALRGLKERVQARENQIFGD